MFTCLISLDEAVKYSQIAAYTAAVFTLIFTAVSYYNINRIKRGEWLKSLFEKFFEQSTFTKIRREIEYNELEFSLAINSSGMATNEEHEEALVNYLNFFEFLATLIKRKHISKSEVLDLFGYYLESLYKNDFIKKYLQQFHFENLTKLLNGFNK